MQLGCVIAGKKYKYNRPGLQTMPWGTRETMANDRFCNRVIFFERKG